MRKTFFLPLGKLSSEKSYRLVLYYVDITLYYNYVFRFTDLEVFCKGSLCAHVFKYKIVTLHSCLQWILTAELGTNFFFSKVTVMRR